MKKNPLNKGVIMENADGVGTVTPAMVEARARELALIDGRDSSKPTEADYQQAKRELTGEEEIDRTAREPRIITRIGSLGSFAGLDRTPGSGISR